jgi:uncharacterized protein (TIGR02246 family)
MLQLRPGCECCDVDLPPDSDAAYLCTFECTFCRDCAEGRLGLQCPNCGGELVRRPRRPASKLGKYPASAERVHKPQGCAGAGRAASEADAIRALVQRWMQATKAGDADTVLSLITRDVVFLRPGHEPMRHDEFAHGQRAQAGGQAPAFEGEAQPQEILVLGEWAVMWTKLRVAGGGTGRAGHTLTVLRKEDGRWRIARDANLLAPVGED